MKLITNSNLEYWKCSDMKYLFVSDFKCIAIIRNNIKANLWFMYDILDVIFMEEI